MKPSSGARSSFDAHQAADSTSSDDAHLAATSLTDTADNNDTEVKAMLHALATFKPRCTDWGTTKGCRRGKKCKFRHCADDSIAVLGDTPSMTRFVDSNGRVSVTPRPPLTQALNALFETRRTVFFLCFT